MPRLIALAGAVCAALLCLASTASAQQQWRILALRADFPLEDPDEFTTTGTGAFDLRPAAEALPDYLSPYDLPPHDRAYFEAHLQALARYYRTVSDGRVEVDFAVFPRENERAYTLPRSALSYGNGRTPEEIGTQWAELLRDAVALADADPDGPVFAEYNSFLVFHAGPGHETGQLNDIRTVYMAPEDLESFLEEPVLADEGAFVVPDGWILPEAVSQQGRAGLNGLLAKFLGHQMGLPGLSNFADGLPALGGWSLMDVGANRLGYVLRDGSLEPGFGFAPPHPTAWTKARLGWIEPLEVRRDTVVQLLATDRRGDLPKALRVPLDGDEYFLLENRQTRGRRGLPAGVEAPFGDTAAVWLDPSDIELSPENGVWLGVEEYDAFVPGSGVLVWHVDEGVIDSALADGAINNDPVRQGIVLEEADGYRDIGNPLFDRIERIEGSPDDAFFAGGTALFNGESVPGSQNNDGLDGGIEIEVLSPPGDTMRVAVRFKRLLAGWPRPAAVGGLRAADADGDGVEELIAEGDEGDFVAWNGRGEVAGRGSGRFVAAGAVGGSPVIFSLSEGRVLGGRAGETAWNEPGAGPVLFNTDLGLLPGRPVVAVGGPETRVLDAADGAVLFTDDFAAARLSAADLDGDGADELVGVSGGAARRWGSDGGGQLWADGPAAPTALLAADLDGSGGAELVLAGAAGIEVRRGGDVWWRRAADPPPVGSPALADIDGDGLIEIIYAAGDRIHAVRGNGLAQGDFPYRLPAFQQTGDWRGGPIALDIDADGRQEIVAAALGGVYGIGGDGALLSGFPLPTEDAPGAVTPVGADIDGDGVLELASWSAGRVYVWDMEELAGAYRPLAGAWLQEGGSEASTYAVPAPAPPADPGAAALVQRAYCYPNPVGPAGRAHMRFVLKSAARVKLEVFDALGRRVDRITPEGEFAAAENEIAWSTADYASGLYVCRLEARGAGGGKRTVFVNMAVSR